MITWKADTGRAVVHVRAHRAAAFRVTLTGFRVTRRTADDPLRRDGADDEVYLTSTSAGFDSRNQRVRGTATRSRVIGDIHDRPDRVLGGSSWDVFKGNGGFTSGDAFPDRHPERVSRPLRDAAPPSLLFAGTLVQGESSLITIPEIWEWDDHPAQPPKGDGTTTVPIPPSTPGFLRVLRATRVNDIELPAVLRRMILRPASAVALPPEPFMRFGATDGTRPIGLRATGTDAYTRDPTAITLTYDLAELAARTDFGHGPGVIRIRYADPPGLDGDYTLYVRIERVT